MFKGGCLQIDYEAQTKTLYRKSDDGILLRFLSKQEAEEVLKKTHECQALNEGRFTLAEKKSCGRRSSEDEELFTQE